MGMLANQMMRCADNPYSTEHDPHLLLAQGADEIRRLERGIEAREAIISALHDANIDMEQMLRTKQADPNAPLYLCGLVMIASVAFVIWTLVT